MLFINVNVNVKYIKLQNIVRCKNGFLKLVVGFEKSTKVITVIITISVYCVFA